MFFFRVCTTFVWKDIQRTWNEFFSAERWLNISSKILLLLLMQILSYNDLFVEHFLEEEMSYILDLKSNLWYTHFQPLQYFFASLFHQVPQETSLVSQPFKSFMRYMQCVELFGALLNDLVEKLNINKKVVFVLLIWNESSLHLQIEYFSTPLLLAEFWINLFGDMVQLMIRYYWIL